MNVIMDENGNELSIILNTEETLSIDKLHDNVKYYCEKINDLEKRTSGAKYFSKPALQILLVSVVLLIFLIARIIVLIKGIELALELASNSDIFDSILSIISSEVTIFLSITTICTSVIILRFERAHSIYLTANQMKYDCRDKLFENLEELKLRGEFKDGKNPKEKELYDILVSEKLEIPEWLQKKRNNRKNKK